MIALLPLLLGLVKGAAIGPLLAGLSVPQWLQIVNGLFTLAPKVRAEFEAVHEVFKHVNANVDVFVPSGVIAEEAARYFVDNPPEEVDRTQEDINQDERMDKIEALLHDLDARVKRIEHDPKYHSFGID